MRPHRLFLASLLGFVALHVLYGFKRWTLGIDFTDEGAYVSWPLRMLFGEKPFASELGTLLRPLVGYLFVIFKVHPDITLYELRLLGWGLHLAAFVVLSLYLFRLSRAAFLSPLVASVPLYVCHIFGLAPPSYNTLSSDFFLLALSLRGLASLEGANGKTALSITSGLALFVATLAHPALGLVAAAMLVWEAFRHGLVRNLLRRTLTPSHAGLLTFIVCWLAFAGLQIATGSAATWLERIVLFRSFTATAIDSQPLRFAFLLLATPFAFSLSALLFSVTALAALVAAFLFIRTRHRHLALPAVHLFALLLVVSLLHTFSHAPNRLPLAFAQTSLLLFAAHGLGLFARLIPAPPAVRFLLTMSVLAAFCYAAVTFYFSPLRSWTSGILALPFPFAVGVILAFRVPADRSTALLRTLVVTSLVLAAACVAREHYRFIYRDSSLPDLTATFRVPKLRHLRSTPERTRAVDELYDYLRPKLARGEPLLAYDDCPLLYYLFEARPVYGLTWATRYTQSADALAQLNRELRSRPLPRYAIRTLVDLSYPVWSDAPRTSYAGYPLNATVTAHYELERTIFPFEILRLKSTAPETTAPRP